MAQYSNYKKVSGESFPTGSIGPAQVATTGLILGMLSGFMVVHVRPVQVAAVFGQFLLV